MKQLEFDYTENRLIRDEAISLSVDGADEVVPNWSGRCYQELIKYVNRVDEFMTEDFRDWCREINFPIPDEQRAFGGVIMGAVKRGLIVHTGKWGEMKSKNCHMNPKKIWRKNI